MVRTPLNPQSQSLRTRWRTMTDDRTLWNPARPENIWTLTPNRKNVRLTVPPVTLSGSAEPLELFLDFDAESVDAVIDRLTVLRSHMLPPLPPPWKRN